MRVTAYALPLLAEGELPSFLRDLASRNTEYSAFRRRLGVTREAVFLQRTPQGSQLLTYRELDTASSAPPGSDGAFESWLSERLSALHGTDPTAGAPRVELLIRQRPPHPGTLYVVALPLLPNKTARLHEFAAELNGIHATEFEESLRRLGFGLTMFTQHSPNFDLVLSVIEGDDPSSALGKLAMSSHPFDRWHLQQIADQTGLDLSAPPPPPNEQLWVWEQTAAPVRAGGKP